MSLSQAASSPVQVVNGNNKSQSKGLPGFRFRSESEAIIFEKSLLSGNVSGDQKKSQVSHPSSGRADRMIQVPTGHSVSPQSLDRLQSKSSRKPFLFS